MQTVVETPSYLAVADRLFSPDERMAIVERLASDPRCGVVIPGSGGIRKVRFGFGLVGGALAGERCEYGLQPGAGVAERVGRKGAPGWLRGDAFEKEVASEQAALDHGRLVILAPTWGVVVRFAW